MNKAFPRLMWADVDKNCKHMPVAIYPSKAEQRGNRSDLVPTPVAVISLSGKNEYELQHDVRAVFTKYLKRQNRKGGAK